MKKPGAFAEMLSGVVKESGIPVSKLALLSGLGRTAIQHVLSGDFLPTRAFLNSLLDSLPASNDQRDAITELYISEKLGREQYLSNMHIKSMLEGIPAILTDQEQKSSVALSPLVLPENSEIVISEGSHNIIDLCIELISDELLKPCPYLALSLPFAFSDFFKALNHLLDHSDRPITIDHFGRLLTNDEVYTNFSKLDIAMRFSLKRNITYQPYYYYSKKGNFDDFFPAYPFSIYTNSCVIMIDEQFSNAVLIHNEKFTLKMAEHLDALKKRSRYMYRLIDGKELEELVYQNRTELKTLGFQPFFINLIPFDMMQEKLTEESRTPEMYNMITRFYDTKKKTICSAFSSEDGLLYFAKTGIIRSRLGSHLSTFTPEERIKLLELMRDNERFRIIDPSVISLSESVHLFALSSQTVIISMIKDKNHIFCRIDESLLVDGFNAFISSLEKAGLLIDNDKKAKLINECIRLAEEQYHQ